MYDNTVHRDYVKSELDYRLDRSAATSPAAAAAGPSSGAGRPGRARSARFADRRAVMGTHSTTENGIMVDVAHTSRTLVGRDAELTEIASSLGVGPSGAGTAEPVGVVLLSGDAGVGKTRLLVELRDLAFTEGWQVFAGHCLDFGDSALPYLPFSEVLGRLAADLPDVVDQVATQYPALARLQPGRRVMGGERPRHRAELRARPDRPLRGRPRAPRDRRREGAGAAGHRGHPLGRPVDPRPPQLPLLPPVRRAGRRGRVVPLRRPAPPPPAPSPGRRVVPLPRRPPGRALARCPTTPSAP